MIKKNIFFAITLTLGLTVNIKAQESKTWNTFLQQKSDKQVTDLPDFSYAGYHRGEKAIPDADYKVFDVTKFGAKPNDKRSDRKAVQKAIRAAEKNGSGIVFFPAGEYRLQEKKDPTKPITISGDKIVLRGSGSGEGGTKLYFAKDLPPKDPNKLWTCPYFIEFTAKGKDAYISNVLNDLEKGESTVHLLSASGLKEGQWVYIRLSNTDPDLIEHEMCGCKVDKSWKSIREKKGIYVKEYHQIKSINGNKVTFYEPVMHKVESQYGWKLYTFASSEEVGVEDIAFVGNWKENFIHHKNPLHDGGYSAVKLGRVVNSYMRRCSFHDFNRISHISGSANVSVINCVITGTPGHSSIGASASSRVFLGKIDDQSSQWHAPGVASSTIGTVIWRVRYTDKTSFESHASQPRATLFDCVEGGFFLGRAGGARQNLPNHMEDLILWNFKETDKAESGFEFWSSKTWFWKLLPPTIVGFHGAGTTFEASQVKIDESHGTPVKPESLYEEQLKLRLGKLPKWLVELKKVEFK
ncbi:DUF4955 domain-containing protein [Halosquirtibacter xylanolyticus]|uniref:DUF4955 domain-containing protein n=1 Tax=Halosquirtibacter xylanolyticus TaxID=3374599 RepID=UPI00374A25C3|nr:DUF4955 domain-containing protein [Prolixibacteraceae bacterium]